MWFLLYGARDLSEESDLDTGENTFLEGLCKRANSSGTSDCVGEGITPEMENETLCEIYDRKRKTVAPL